MGIETKTVRIITCDYCGNQCGEDDSRIDFAINGGDGRDVGPTRIQGQITLFQPYRCATGILCNSCLLRFLRMFLDSPKIED
jgi:hypothetical protein